MMADISSSRARGWVAARRPTIHGSCRRRAKRSRNHSWSRRSISFMARVSPDSHWIAYATNDSGMYQIVVQSFPDPNGGKWQITAQGGVEPKWRHDGRELYYLALDGKLMSVPVKGDRTFQAGTPRPLFPTPLNVNRAQPES